MCIRDRFDTVEIKDTKIEIGTLVKTLRKQRGLSQTDLASALDVSRTTIQNLELGKNFKIDTVLKIFKEFDLLENLHQLIVKEREQVANTKSLY